MEVVVLLRNGTTNLTEVATILGYSNHSEVSRQLARIRDHVCPCLRQELEDPVEPVSERTFHLNFPPIYGVSSVAHR